MYVLLSKLVFDETIEQHWYNLQYVLICADGKLQYRLHDDILILSQQSKTKTNRLNIRVASAKLTPNDH